MAVGHALQVGQGALVVNDDGLNEAAAGYHWTDYQQ